MQFLSDSRKILTGKSNYTFKKQVLLEKSLGSSGLTLSLMKKCGCAQNRNPWQCKSNCRNGSGSDTQGISIPVPQNNI
jgi:hypothetical protein